MHVRTGTAAAGGRAAAGPPSQPVIAHQPAEPSAMARASITRICVSGSNSGPVQARGIAMPKTPASFIAAAIDCGIRRPLSISSLAARIWSASPIVACRTGESSVPASPLKYVIDEVSHHFEAIAGPPQAAFLTRHIRERCGTDALIGSIRVLGMVSLTWLRPATADRYLGSPSSLHACHQP